MTSAPQEFAVTNRWIVMMEMSALWIIAQAESAPIPPLAATTMTPAPLTSAMQTEIALMLRFAQMIMTPAQQTIVRAVSASILRSIAMMEFPAQQTIAPTESALPSLPARLTMATPARTITA